MSRSSVLGKIRPRTVIPAVLVGALAVTGLSQAPHTSLGDDVKLASATTPTDGVSYEMATGVHSEIAHRYDRIIDDLRRRVNGTPLYGGITLARNVDDYFPVSLVMDEHNSVTLVFNARNLYIVGWRNDATNQYYRLGEGPSTYAGARANELDDWVNYNGMERHAAISRDSLGISLTTIQGSIRELGSARYTSAGRDQARALLILTQAFAEGARFDFIANRVSDAIRNSQSYTTGTSSVISSNRPTGGGPFLNVNAVDFENNWSGLSIAALQSTRNHVTPHYRIGDGYLTTMEAIDAQLAVALWHSF
ncbi:ribosome-inactivating family protein [Streptomyces sp. NPDC004539]|uniref:ribosome-inactivating family protein n=1 Tax=Streptomyces sp. NPDC004539 TaxID=3154280 RepID=UPI0033A574F4